MEFTGFTADHVGEKVTDIIRGEGVIEGFKGNNDYPVKVAFKKFRGIESYSLTGYYHASNKIRSLYFGHNLTIKVEGEVVPEPKLICPVCGAEHEIFFNYNENCFYIKGLIDCPFFNSMFKTEIIAKQAMENLIEAMEPK